MKHHRMWLSGAAITLIATLLSVTSAGAAPTRSSISKVDSAIPRPAGVPGTAKLVKGTMSLDCAHLTRSAKKYADTKGYCSGNHGRLRPNDVREGDCGYSYLYMWNDGAGYAGMSYGVGSYLGAILHIASGVSWGNWDNGNTGIALGDDFPWSSTVDFVADPYTGAGFVVGAYSGSITLVWGGSCTILIPTASTYVS